MFVIRTTGQFLKVKVAEQVLNIMQQKSATAGTVTQNNDFRKTL